MELVSKTALRFGEDLQFVDVTVFVTPPPFVANAEMEKFKLERAVIMEEELEPIPTLMVASIALKREIAPKAL